MHFVKGAVSLRNYVLANVDMTEFEGLDLEHEGIIVKLKNDKPVFKCVAGRKRPAMAILGLFGGVEMSRTYKDEIMEHMFDDQKDFDI